MFFISVKFHYYFTQALQKLFFFGLLLDHLFFNELTSHGWMTVKNGKQKLAENSLGEEKIMIGENSCFIILHKLLEIRGKLSVKVLIFGSKCLNSTIEFIFFELVIFDNRFLKLSQ